MATTVVLGTGIIGAATAYYLSEHQPGSSIHLVEASPEIFASASGYAGGFLAKDWFSPGSAALGSLSFEEHRKLAEKEDGAKNWNYSQTTSLSLTAARENSKHKCADDWLREGGSRAEAVEGVEQSLAKATAFKWLKRQEDYDAEVIGEKGSTAQVDPLRLSKFILRKCQDTGVHLHHPAKAISITTDVRNELSSVCIADTLSSTETDVPCTRLLIAAGAWSAEAFSTIFNTSNFKIPVSGLAGHSLVVRSPRWTKDEEIGGTYALFLSARADYSPELFTRLGGNIYIAGLNSATEALPKLASETKVQASAIKKLRETASQLLGPGTGEDKDDLEVVREGLCFRPVTDNGLPLICRIPDEHLGESVSTRPGSEGGVYVASGHGPWGISLSLGTGKVMAEMIQGRPLSADVSSLGLTM